MPKLLKYGHAPGHVRGTAIAAFYAWSDWDGNGPEPTVEYEIQYVPHEIPISRACGLVWNCTDVVPGLTFGVVQEAFESTPELAPKRQTYAACARAILAKIQSRRAEAA